MNQANGISMTLNNTRTSYGSVAKTFHWLSFIIISCLLAMGFIMADMAISPDKFKLIGLHKSFGITLLLLVVFRLGWKIKSLSPQLPASMHRIEKLLAKAGHGMLYVLMFAMPLTGWGMSSAAGIPVSVFGLFTLPDMVAPDKGLKGELRELHGVLAWVLIAMVALHVLAALLHHFYYKNNVLIRMLPFTKEKYALDSDTHTGC